MADDPRRQFAQDGYLIVSSLLPASLMARVLPRIDAVYRGEYQTGIAPGRNLPPSADPPASLVKIDNAHRSDAVILEVVSHAEVGKWAAAITGARMVQVFATQLLIKPPGKDPAVNVGWHQDQEYWDAALEGELLTAWIAVSDVPAAAGDRKSVV
jgi:phytanoyl-CoA hydroxylase